MYQISQSLPKVRPPPNYYEEGIKQNLLKRWWHKKRFAHVLPLVSDLKGSLLDIGCAGGLFTAKIKKANPSLEITAIDLDKEAIKYAQKKYPQIKFLTADAHLLPFKNNSFESIICLEALEHVTDPQKVISEIKRCLKPKGVFIFLVPTDSILFKLLWPLWLKTFGKDWQEAHNQNFSAKEFISKISSRGFKIQEKKFFNSRMLVAIKASLNGYRETGSK